MAENNKFDRNEYFRKFMLGFHASCNMSHRLFFMILKYSELPDAVEIRGLIPWETVKVSLKIAKLAPIS